jgi:sugar phosphate isomerase/epimerase
MQLGVAAWSFAQCTLPEAMDLAEALGFECIDVGTNNFKPALDRRQLSQDPAAYGRHVARQTPLKIANLYCLFGRDRYERNLSDAKNHQQNIEEFRHVAKFCEAASLPTAFVLPGVVNRGQSRSEAIAVSVEALKRLVEIGSAAGLTVLIEAHVMSLIKTPDDTLEFLEKVPGLKLALDPSHFTMQGVSQADVHRLIAHAGHVHLRQAAPGQLQRKLEDGTIDFPALFAALRDVGYSGCLATEYIHAPAMAAYPVDVLTETIKMRDCFRAWRG